jgi:gamma-glutamyltranspeptidase
VRLVRFGSRNLFFGGVQAVQHRPGERSAGAGDPRRGGVAVGA